MTKVYQCETWRRRKQSRPRRGRVLPRGARGARRPRGARRARGARGARRPRGARVPPQLEYIALRVSPAHILIATHICINVAVLLYIRCGACVVD